MIVLNIINSEDFSKKKDLNIIFQTYLMPEPVSDFSYYM
jgi:hypothetical protein